jgi:hypothetical protein
LKVSKVLPRIAVAVILVAAAVALNFLLDAPSEDERAVFNLTCDFIARPDQPPVVLGRYSGSMEAITFEGTLSDQFQQSFRFAGRARYRIEGQDISADARGSVFIFTPGQIDAVMLTVNADGFGRNGLRVATLNEEGMLDERSDTVYAWTNKDFRLSHPMAIDCALSDPDPTIWEQLAL